MCKEDVRLARAASPGSVATNSPGNVLTKFLNGNAERYSLMAGFVNLAGSAAPCTVLVYSVIGGLFYPLIGLSLDHPAGTVSLIDVGSVIEGEIWAVVPDGVNNPSIVVSETKWNQPQGEI